MIHIFDVDNTVIKKSSVWYFLLEAMKNGTIRFRQISRLPFEWVKYKLGKPDLDFIEKAVKHLEGVEKKALEQVAETSFEHRIKPKIYPGTERLIIEALERNEKVIFATTSFHIVIRPLERFFGIEGSLACDLEFDNGRATGRLVGESLFGSKKKTSVQAWLDRNGFRREDVCFYSDSYVDIPLLEFCGKPVAVNPDRVLARKAKKHGWEILRF